MKDFGMTKKTESETVQESVCNSRKKNKRWTEVFQIFASEASKAFKQKAVHLDANIYYEIYCLVVKTVTNG